MATDRELKSFYRAALGRVFKRGWEHEIKYFRNLKFENVDGVFFFREYSFCVYAAGFSNYVLNIKWPGLTKAYKNWDYNMVSRDANNVRREALGLIKYPNKVEAILESARQLHDRGWPYFKKMLLKTNLLLKPRQMKYIGEAGRYHLARNIGADVAKPDRYLIDAASKYGYLPTDYGVQEFAVRISKLVGERPGVVDYVLWRDYEGSSSGGNARSEGIKT